MNNVGIQNVNKMSKYNQIKCPFCGNVIKPTYIVKETIIRKKHRNKIRKQKIYVGIDVEKHKQHCIEYKNFCKL